MTLKISPFNLFELAERLKCSHFYAPQKSWYLKDQPVFLFTFFLLIFPIAFGKAASNHDLGLMVFPSLIPPEVQKELIRRIVHRDLLDPKHMTNLHAHYNVKFPPREIASGESIVAKPKDPTVHPKALSYLEVMTKKLRWITLGGQYDWTNKVYPEEEPPKFPSDIANLVEGLFPDMEPQAAIVNFYSPKDTLQLHRDGAESVDRGLVSISLGCDCIFMIALDNPKSENDHLVLRLKSGDVLYMQKDSRFAWHGVPKIIPDTCPDYLADLELDIKKFPHFMTDKRINLNVRQVRERKSDR